MAGKTTSLEVRRRGEKVILYAMGRTPRGTKYIVNSLEMAQHPLTHKIDVSKIALEIAEVIGQTPA